MDIITYKKHMGRVDPEEQNRVMGEGFENVSYPKFFHKK